MIIVWENLYHLSCESGVCAALLLRCVAEQLLRRLRAPLCFVRRVGCCSPVECAFSWTSKHVRRS